MPPCAMKRPNSSNKFSDDRVAGHGKSSDAWLILIMFSGNSTYSSSNKEAAPDDEDDDNDNKEEEENGVPRDRLHLLNIDHSQQHRLVW